MSATTRILVVMCVVTAVSCGGSGGGVGAPTSPTPTAAPPPAPAPAPAPPPAAFDVNGSWNGSIGGATFSFTVSNGGITTMTLRQMPGCGSLIEGWSTFGTMVSANAFSYTASANHPGISGSINGRFTSATSASGDMNVTLKTGCRITLSGGWTAAKS